MNGIVSRSASSLIGDLISVFSFKVEQAERFFLEATCVNIYAWWILSTTLFEIFLKRNRGEMDCMSIEDQLINIFMKSLGRLKFHEMCTRLRLHCIEDE